MSHHNDNKEKEYLFISGMIFMLMVWAFVETWL